MRSLAVGLSPAHHLEKLIAACPRANKAKVLLVVGGTIATIAVVDGAVLGNRASLGLLYILPMMLAATVLPPLETIALALVCALLRSLFDTPCPPVETLLRLIFALATYTSAALLVTAWVRHRELVVGHLQRMQQEQVLRQRLEDQLHTLVDSSPAAILTLDAGGVVLASNRAADALLLVKAGDCLRGKSIAGFLPVLADALKIDPGSEGLRTSAQCQGRRENGEMFLAQMWFSSYVGPQGPRLAAIVVDASEEMRDREEQGLRHLMRGNQIAASAVSHEVRNLCSAMVLLCSNLERKPQIAGDADLHGLTTLAAGLERMARGDLHAQTHDAPSHVPLREVLDDLRIVIEPGWCDINGVVAWNLPATMPVVVGERHGVLQTFLNLAQNSHRAVLPRETRELRITVSSQGVAVHIDFEDSGAGVGDPQHLFEPFHSGEDGAGLGLYVSRAMMRSYGGDLRYEPRAGCACFRVELQMVGEA